MRPLRFLTFLMFLFTGISASAQMRFSGEAALQGNYATDTKLPFWMYHNTRGRISEDTQVAGLLSAQAVYEISPNLTLEMGAGLLLRDGERDNAFVDEAYVQLETPDFYLIGGVKQKEELYNGLSASNESMLWSLNARPLPGIQMGTKGTYFLNRLRDIGFGIEASWNEFILEEDRHLPNVRVHYKNLFLVYHTYNGIKLKGGLRHFAQWGFSRPSGQKARSAEDYLKVITGTGSNVSNYIGSYEFHIGKDFMNIEVEFFYNHIFNSFSGARFSNAPDGRYGIFIKTKDEDRVINSFIYEFYLSQNQHSPEKGVEENLNYFNDKTYQSGWTYHNRVIGVPFFTSSANIQGITNNRFAAHHIGIGGQFSDYFNVFPYRVLLSFASNEGTLLNPYPSRENVFHMYSDFGIFRRFIDIDIQGGMEWNDRLSPVYGIGLKVSKGF